jgi:hypothetical protein
MAKRLEREWAERGALFGKHHGELTLRGTVDARVGPVRFLAIEIDLRLIERFETQPPRRRLLRVSDAGLTLPLRSGSPTRHGCATAP